MSTWTDITKRAIGKCLPKSVLDAVIDNLVWLKNAIGGAGAVEGIVNGSFESDADADGRPDGWTWTASGGSIAIESTAPGHGAKALKITSSGSGGGNVVHDDYILCAPQTTVILSFLHWSSDAGLADTVELLWYDKAKAYLSATTVYTDSATNPATATRFMCGAAPPANAMFCRPRITGANDATTGSSYWDGFEIIHGDSGSSLYFVISEQTSVSLTWEDKATIRTFVPFGASRLSILGQLKISTGPTGYCRYRIGSVYSDEKTATAGGWEDVTNTMDVSSVAGTAVSLILQLKHSSGGGASTEYTNTGERIYFY